MYLNRQFPQMLGYTVVAMGLGGLTPMGGFAPLGAFTEVSDPNEYVKPAKADKVKSTPTYGGGSSSSSKSKAGIASAAGGVFGTPTADPSGRSKVEPGKSETPGSDVLVTPRGGGEIVPTPNVTPTPTIVQNPHHIPIAAIVAGGVAAAGLVGVGVYAISKRRKAA